MESLLVGAGLGYFKEENGLSVFVEYEGVVVDHIGPYYTSDAPPEPEVLLASNSYFFPSVILKDGRWHTNIRTQKELYQAQKQYLPLIPPPAYPIKRLA